MPCNRFKSNNQRKFVMAKLKSRYTKHSTPCSYCSKHDCKSCKFKNMKFNRTQLNIGRKVELEHTKIKSVADKIAKDHLKENPKYYTKLVKCGL